MDNLKIRNDVRVYHFVKNVILAIVIINVISLALGGSVK